MWILLLSIPYPFAPSSSSPKFFTSRGDIGKGKERYMIINIHLGWRPSSSCLQWTSPVICSNLHMNLGCKKFHNIRPFYHDQFFQRMNLHDTSMMLLRVCLFACCTNRGEVDHLCNFHPFNGPSSSHSHFPSHTIHS